VKREDGIAEWIGENGSRSRDAELEA